MRNATKLLAFVLAFVMVLSMVPMASAQTVHTHGIEEYPEIFANEEVLVSIGEPEPTSTENPFSDVKEGDFFYKAVLWAIEKVITNGISETEFGISSNCNRAQAVTFLYRALAD